ncbi:uncharacterized protein TrAtP1_001225 [Trichoderma atroviride]|uniref:uncharacterized protein n=1 Tax=Hypocrea atroviridis TaxID=63577 RepID=UPI00332B052B|nr:hypothetical protein TrAtP1_001225 [Trichoderma atroviride]
MQATRGRLREFRRRRRERQQVSPSFGVPGCATGEYRRRKYPAAPGADAVKVYCVPACDLIFWNTSKLSAAARAANGRLDAPIRQARLGGFLCCHAAWSPFGSSSDAVQKAPGTQRPKA